MTPKLLRVVLPVAERAELRVALRRQGRVHGARPMPEWSAACEKSSGLRVMMSTEPATPPSTKEALELFCTTTLLTISEGSSV